MQLEVKMTNLNLQVMFPMNHCSVPNEDFIITVKIIKHELDWPYKTLKHCTFFIFSQSKTSGLNFD